MLWIYIHYMKICNTLSKKKKKKATTTLITKSPLLNLQSIRQFPGKVFHWVVCAGHKRTAVASSITATVAVVQGPGSPLHSHISVRRCICTICTLSTETRRTTMNTRWRRREEEKQLGTVRIKECGGCGWGEGIGSTTGRGVISRDAITASLQQSRKRLVKWGRSQSAGLVLGPCSHSPRSLLPPLVSSGLQLSVCPLDGYVHTDAAVKTAINGPPI